MVIKKEMTELDNKIKLFEPKITKTEEIIPKRDRQASKLLRLSISSLANAVDELKLTMEEVKIEKGESEEEIALWGKEKIEDKLGRADNTIRRIEGAMEANDLEEQEREAIEKYKKNMEFERQLPE